MSGSLPPKEPDLSNPCARNTKWCLRSASVSDGQHDAAEMDITTEQPGAWVGETLAAKLRKLVTKPPVYTGEDNMDDEETLDLSNLVDPLKTVKTDLAMPVIDFTLEECQLL